jgi:hypothetical protein
MSSVPHSSSIANLQTASKLILSSRLVYSQPLDLPEAVEVIRATPSAGKVLLRLSSGISECYLPMHVLQWHRVVIASTDPPFRNRFGFSPHSFFFFWLFTLHPLFPLLPVPPLQVFLPITPPLGYHPPWDS